MRLAQERMQTLESAENVRRSAKAGVAAVQSSGRGLRYAGLAATGLLAAGICSFVAKGLKRAPKTLPVAAARVGFFKTLVLQGATLVVFPYLRELLSRSMAANGQAPAPLPSFDLSRFHPAHLFFRWLGLEK